MATLAVPAAAAPPPLVAASSFRSSKQDGSGRVSSVMAVLPAAASNSNLSLASALPYGRGIHQHRQSLLHISPMPRWLQVRGSQLQEKLQQNSRNSQVQEIQCQSSRAQQHPHCLMTRRSRLQQRVSLSSSSWLGSSSVMSSSLRRVNPMRRPLSNRPIFVLHMRWQPRFVPVTDVAGAENLSKYSDEATGVVQRRLSNGICVNYKPKEKDFGFLSLNRAMALDSMDLDLSQELSKPSKATLDRQVAVARQMAAGAATAKRADENKPKWRFAPTKREEEQWARAKKAVSGGTEHLLQEVNRERKDPVKEAAAARERYLKLKNNLQNVTLAVGGAGLTGAYFSYSPEIAASYGVGLLGALVYIRMLGNSVDSVGARDAGGAARGALGQPRLLVPVVLVMAFNRWNGLVVPEYGVMPLQLIPMLVGFFTYKAATFVETFKELLPDSAKQEKEN